jgi:hypothetical protein
VANTTYPFPAAATSLYVSSDDASDANLGITIIGLDANWAEQTVVTTLGAAAVTSGTAFKLVGTATNWMRVYRAFNSSETDYTGEIYIHTDDTDTGNDGVPDAGTTQILACIMVEDAQTQMAIYTVPLGFRALLIDSTVLANPGAAATARAVDTHMLTRESGGVFRIQEHTGIITTGTGIIHQRYGILRSFPEKTDIKIRASQPSASLEVGASFGLWLVPNAAVIP